MPVSKPSTGSDDAYGALAAAGRPQFHLIDAANVGRHLVASARRVLVQSFIRATQTDRPVEDKVVVYNIRDAMSRTRHSKNKAPGAGLRIVGKEICSGLEDKGMLDYCFRNVALFEGAPPSEDQLPKKFRKASLQRTLRGMKRGPMTEKSARGDFELIVEGQAGEPADAFDSALLLQGLKRIKKKIRTVLDHSQTSSRLKV